MKVKPHGQGTVMMEVGKREEELLAAKGAVESLPIRHILAPIDFSECSQKTLEYAAAFARQHQAQITLLHVVPLNYVDTDLIAFDYAQIQKEAAASAQTRLTKLIQSRIDAELTTNIRVAVGRAVDEIVSVAAEIKADLIIMSTHGYTGLRHAFLGSTTENVVRYAPCPVLTLRLNERDFVSSPGQRV